MAKKLDSTVIGAMAGLQQKIAFWKTMKQDLATKNILISYRKELYDLKVEYGCL